MTVKRKIWNVNWPKNISPIKLARALNVSPQRVNFWMKNNTLPDDMVDKIKSLRDKDVLQ